MFREYGLFRIGLLALCDVQQPFFDVLRLDEGGCAGNANLDLIASGMR
jgi:hypothetical protein